MILAELNRAEQARRLRQEGLSLATGDWTVRIRSRLPAVREGLALLYGDYPVIEGADYADFQVSVESSGGLRRWVRPQALFFADGHLPFKPLPLDQAFPMLEWGLNWCISAHCHDHLMVHAAVLERDGGACILPAPPGSGKSTLCAALACRGWRLLSDELTLIRLADGRIAPLPRPVSLKNDSIGLIRSLVPDATFSRVVTDTVKGSVAHMKPPRESVARALETASARWLVFPRWQEGAGAKLTPLPRAEAFLRVAENAFNYGQLGEAGFQALADAVAPCRCCEFRYGRLEDALRVFAEL